MMTVTICFVIPLIEMETVLLVIVITVMIVWDSGKARSERGTRGIKIQAGRRTTSVMG